MFEIIFDQASQERVYAVVLAALFGAFLGIRREISAQASARNRSFMGLRTMTLLSTLGALSTFFEKLPFLPVVIFGAIIVLTAIAYANGSFNLKRIGITTELSAFITFWIGVMVAEQMITTALLITVILAFSNAYKQEVKSFVKTLSIKEWRGALQMVILTGLVLPLLPQTAIDPWGIFNPFETWFLVILISGIGFVGYFLIKYFGSRAGIPLMSLLGGLVSSTAVTMAMCAKSKKSEIQGLFSTGILIALVTMQMKVFIYLISLGQGIDWSLRLYLLPWMLAGFCGLGATYYFFTKKDEALTEQRWSKGGSEKPSKDLEVESPFEIVPALKFGLLYIALLAVLYFSHKYLGNLGVYGAAIFSGMIDIDSIVLASLRETISGTMSSALAEDAIALAVIFNTLVKVAFVRFMGAKYIFKEVVVVVIPSVLISAAIFFLL